MRACGDNLYSVVMCTYKLQNVLCTICKWLDAIMEVHHCHCLGAYIYMPTNTKMFTCDCLHASLRYLSEPACLCPSLARPWPWRRAAHIDGKWVVALASAQ